MLRIALAIFALVAFQASAVAQLYPYQWRIGVSAGYATYHGDLSPFRFEKFSDIGKVFRLYDLNPNYVPEASFGLSIETQLNHTLGLSLKGGRYSFAMSDRFVDRSGNLKTNAPNFNRALNFKAEVIDVGLSLLFRSDNGRILNKKALIAPYLGLGAGVLWFDVYGDLYHSDGQQYAHSDQTITDGEYETALRPLRTELSDGYGKSSFYAELSLGIRFRLAHRWELFIQSDIKYTATDYLDDVSGKYRNFYTSAEQLYAANPTGLPENGGQNYRGNPNGANDIYLYHAAGIKFSFGHSKEAFRAPVVHPSSHKQPGLKSEVKAPTIVRKTEKPAELNTTKAKEVVLDSEIQSEVESALVWIEREFEVLSIRKAEQEIEAKRDSLQLVVARLEYINDTLVYISDSLSVSDSTAILHAVLNAKMAVWEKRLDSLGALHREIEERYPDIEAPAARVDTLAGFAPELVADSIVAIDTVAALVHEPATDTVKIPATPIDRLGVVAPEMVADSVIESAVDRAIEKSMGTQREPQVRVDSTETPKIRVAPEEDNQTILIQYLQRQEKKDSIIIDQLTRLLEESDQPRTQRSAPAPYTEQDNQPELRSSPSETNNAELESLRSEVNYLKELILEQNRKRSSPSVTPSVGVVVAPESGKKSEKDEKITADSSELDNLQMQMVAMQQQMEELRKQNRLQRYELEQSLKKESRTAVITPPADSLPTDTVVAPPLTEAKTDTVVAPSQPDSAQVLPEPDPRDAPTPDPVEKVVAPKDTVISKKPEVVAPPVAQEFKVENIYFDLNAQTPSSAEVEKIAKAAKHWKADKAQRIILKSYADNSGNADYNRKLCERRNAAVKQVLINQYDVDPTVIVSSVGGPVKRPNESVYSPLDRRVEIAVKY